jgi:hypothetical protein
MVIKHVPGSIGCLPMTELTAETLPRYLDGITKKNVRDALSAVGCKAVIGLRLKESGMFWTVRGANAILSIRCCHLNGRFEDYWAGAGPLDLHFYVAHPESGARPAPALEGVLSLRGCLNQGGPRYRKTNWLRENC